MNTLSIWIAATRPKTLGASLCPVLVGAALALHDGVFAFTPVMLALLGACLLQIASNFANDLFDGLRGADSGARIGPTRAVGSGLVTPKAMRVAVCIALALAAVPATFLAQRAGSAFAFIGVIGALCAVAYTAPPIALAYRGLGEVFVFAFFGPLAVAGTRAACDGQWTVPALVCGIGPGAIAVCLLATNNLRDHVNDAVVGKRTLAVRFGPRAARVEITACHAAAFALPIVAGMAFHLPLGILLASVVAAVFARASFSLWFERPTNSLNANLSMFGALLYLYGVAFAAGVWLGVVVKGPSL